MAPHDIELLKFAHAYGVILQATTEVLGAPEGNSWLKRMCGRGLLTRRTLGGGRLCYYQPSKRGCVLLGKPTTRAKRLGPVALHRRLSVLVWATMRGSRKTLRSRASLEKSVDPLPPGVYATEETGQGTLIWLLYVPGPETSARTIARKLHAKFHQVSTELIESGQLKVAAIVLPEQVAGVKEHLDRRKLRRRVRVLPGCGWNVAEAVREWRASRVPCESSRFPNAR